MGGNQLGCLDDRYRLQNNKATNFRGFTTGISGGGLRGSRYFQNIDFCMVIVNLDMNAKI